MAQNTQFAMIVLLFIVGCSAVVNADLSDCTNEEIEECSSFMAQLNNTGPEKLCSGILDEALGCFMQLEKKCVLSTEQQAVVNETKSKIEMSKNGCKDMTNPSPAPPAKTTCLDSDVKKCQMMMEASNPAVPKCSLLTTVANCTGEALVNCLNETTKNTLKEMEAAVNKNMTDLKCCDMVAIEKCGANKYQITNETITSQLCSSVSESKTCIVKQLDACEDTTVKQPLEQAVTAMTEGLELCESKGLLGGSSTLQPALVLLLTACLATLYKFV